MKKSLVYTKTGDRGTTGLEEHACRKHIFVWRPMVR